MLQRINELCVQAGNGTLSDVDRSSIDVEIQQMKDEIQRVSDETEFNGQTLLNGTFALRGYTDNKNVKVQSYDSSITAGKAYSIGIGSTDTGGVINFDSNGYITTDISKLTLNIPTSVTVDGSTVTNKVPADAKIESISDNGITITGSAGFSVTLALSKDYDGTDVQLDLTGLGAMTVQIGANEGQTLDIDIPDVGISALGMTSLNAKTQDSATEGIGRVSKALEIVSAVRGKLGAYQNRLESTGRSNDTAKENMTSALSNITDVDMAEEYSTYATYQILQQASTSVLSQANKQPSDVLQLLQ
jgi:flagellin